MKILVLILSLFLPLSAWANMEEFFAALNKLPPAERQQKLIEGAKKEGEVMLYSSSGLEEVRAMTKLFERTYPFLKARFLRQGGGQLFKVAQMEYTGQKHIVDVYWAGHSTLGPIVSLEKGMLARYLSPERAAIGDEFKDKAGYWTATRMSVAIFAYHSKKVPVEKVPKTYPDLLDPFWKGKIAVDTNPDRSTLLLVARMGWEGAEAYLKKLAQQEPRIHRGRSARLQLILSGEAVGGLDINADNIVALQKQGAPVEYAILNPALLSLTSVALPQKSPHPHAAVLLYDLMISKEGQEELAKEDNVPVRDDVEIKAKGLGPRMKEARAKKQFMVQSPATYDPAQEEKMDRLYIATLIKKSK
ncbi:MAG: ABC transporter substrate-binding protein [Candidatus Binatia bacterium]